MFFFLIFIRKYNGTVTLNVPRKPWGNRKTWGIIGRILLEIDIDLKPRSRCFRFLMGSKTVSLGRIIFSNSFAELHLYATSCL